jgi:ATP-binding cassette, subfamily F, member 3
LHLLFLYLCSIMIALQNIYVQYGNRILLDHVTLTIKAGECIGLVGRNGAGKSTLMKIIEGEMAPHEGEVIKPTGFSFGYLHQDMLLPKGKTVIEEAMTAFEEMKALDDELHNVQIQLTERTDYESDSYSDLVERMSELAERLHTLEADTMQSQAEKILSGLGFKASDMHRQTTEFSGGWQMRIELAKMLLRAPDMLLLDEPTNHLDIESILWLEAFLKGYPGMAVVISHDKQFLDNVTNRTVEVVLGRIQDYKAAYSRYLELSADRREQMQSAFDNQQRTIADRERTIARFMASATKTKMAQSMQKQLNKMDRIEIEDENTKVMNLRFPTPPRAGEVVVECKAAGKSYGSNNILENVDLKILRGERVSFVGQNGQGKTTLAKLILGQEPASDGTIALGHNVHIGYYAQNQAETLDPKITLLETMEKYSPPELRMRLRSILGSFMFSGEDVDKKVSVLSGGERARLALACMLLRPINFLVMDEPTNHLDMLSKDMLKQAILEFDGALLVVSHDRDFLAGLTNRTLEFRDRKVTEYLGDINYFLNKRSVDNIREIEKRDVVKPGQSAVAVMAAPKVSTLTPDEKKLYQRVVLRTEKRIEELEIDTKKMEYLMAQSDFYTKTDSQIQVERYQNMQKEMEKVMAEWDDAVMKLG